MDPGTQRALLDLLPAEILFMVIDYLSFYELKHESHERECESHEAFADYTLYKTYSPLHTDLRNISQGQRQLFGGGIALDVLQSAIAGLVNLAKLTMPYTGFPSVNDPRPRWDVSYMGFLPMDVRRPGWNKYERQVQCELVFGLTAVGARTNRDHIQVISAPSSRQGGMAMPAPGALN